MTPEDWEQLKSAHARALNCSELERDRLLQEEFPDKPEVAEKVRELLRWHDEAGRFMTTPLAMRMVEPLASDYNVRRLGPWELIRELGSGGSATVYLARRIDDLFEKQVAIKLLNRLTTSEESFRRFQREIQILASVEHPYIVRLFEAGTTDEAIAFIVTEFVQGRPIDEACRPLDLREKLEIFCKVCEGIEYAHGKRIVHRDIKPSNILVGEHGTPKILDFGIAVFLDRDSRLTGTGLERMTIQYASPEQVRGERQLNASSDVYSLGVILYELLAGRSPYGGGKHEVAAWILSKDPPPLKGLPRDVASIVLKALQKTPDRRYEAVGSLRDDLERFLNGRAVVAHGDRAIYRVGKFLRRHWKTAGLVAAGAVLAFVGSILFRGRSSQENPVTALAVPLSEGHPLSLSFSPDGGRLYYLAGDVFYDYADLFVKDPRTGLQMRLTDDGVFKLGVAASPDGKFVGYLRAASESTTSLTILPAGGGAQRKLFTDTSGSFCWSTNGDSVIVGRHEDGDVWPHLAAFSLKTNEWRDVTARPLEGRGDGSPALSPDGRTLCFVRQESRESADLFLLPVDSTLRPEGTPRRLTSRRLRIASPRWTPDGKEIVYAGGTLGHYRLFRVAADGRSEPREIREAGSGVSALAVAGRSRDLAVQRSETRTAVWQLNLSGMGHGTIARARLFEATINADSAAFSPDGRRVSYISAQSGESEIWIANAGGTEPRQLTFYPAPDIISSVWLPDSSGLVVSVRSRALGLRNYIIGLTGSVERELPKLPGVPCSFSRDGKWLYFSFFNKDTDIYRYSPETGEIRQVTRGARGSYAMESPDGRTIYFSKPEAELGLWKISAEGGVPSRVLPNLARRTLFDVRDEGIYYMERLARSVVMKLHRPDGADQVIYSSATIPSWGFSLSADGRRFLLAFEDSSDSALLLLHGFR